MKVVGLVTEYNPFHKGHEYHIKKSREITGADHVVVVMSGNYVQRGEPAIVDKWTRTQTALACGADIVIEIPVHYATASAEFFAAASVALLEATGIVDCICFGSECGDMQMLSDIADFLADETDEFKQGLDFYLQQGLNFPKARAKVLNDILGEAYHKVIQSPNNILGIEYLKAIKRQKSRIVPYTITRKGAGYHDIDPHAIVVSASAVRRQLNHVEVDRMLLRDMLPPAAYEHLHRAMERTSAPIAMADFFPLLRYQLLNMTPFQLSQVLDVTEGLQHRIRSGLVMAASMADLLDTLETKRYTRTKLSRALLHTVLQIDRRTLEIFNRNGYAQYLKVLGFRHDSRHLMRALKEDAHLPIIVNVKDMISSLTSLQTRMLMDEIRATQVYNTVILNKFGYMMRNDYTQPIVVFKGDPL